MPTEKAFGGSTVLVFDAMEAAAGLKMLLEELARLGIHHPHVMGRLDLNTAVEVHRTL